MGLGIGTALQVTTAIRHLRTHHSKSNLPALAAARLKAGAAMESPWCYRCNCYVTKGSNFCKTCGKKVYSTYENQEDAAEPPWQNTWSRAPSPRGRQPSPGRDKGKGKGGKNGGAGKGGKKNGGVKGGGKDGKPPGSRTRNPPQDTKLIVDATPPSLTGLPTPPAAGTVALPKPAARATALGEQPDNKLLSALVAHVQSLGAVPPELRMLVDAHVQNSTRQEGILLHRLVTQKQTAKQALDKVRVERLHFASAWQDYVTQLLELWGQQLEAHEKAMTKFHEAEMSWQAEFVSASTALQDQVRGGVVIEPDEENSDENMTALATDAEAEARAAQATQQHQLLRNLFEQARETAHSTTRSLKRGRENSRSPRRARKDSAADPRALGETAQDAAAAAVAVMETTATNAAKMAKAQATAQAPATAVLPPH